MEIDSPASTVVDSQLNNILSQSIDEPSYTETLRALADASRSDTTIRTKLSDPQIVRKLVDTLKNCPVQSDKQDVLAETLRCLGNACALNPAAANLITHDVDLGWFKRLLSPLYPKQVQDLSTKVLYNICSATTSPDSDDGPDSSDDQALLVWHDAGVHLELIRYLAALPVDLDDDEYLTDTLFWIVSAKPQADNTILAEQELPADLLTKCTVLMKKSVTSLAPDALATLLESIITLFRPTSVHRQLISQDLGLPIFRIFEDLELRLAQAHPLANGANSADDSTQSDVVPVLLPQSTGLTWLLSDISAEPEFVQRSGIENDLVRHVLHIMQNMNEAARSERRTTSACLVLGNVLLNLPEATTATIVFQGTIHNTAFSLIAASDSSPDALHALAGLLTVLCRPSVEVREKMCEHDQAVSVVRHLCQHQVPQIRESGVRLLKALGRDSPSNQQRLAAIAREVETAARSMAEAGA